jgi:hypothetical protein
MSGCDHSSGREHLTGSSRVLVPPDNCCLRFSFPQPARSIPQQRPAAARCSDSAAGKPEVREYRAIYVLGDAEIGNFSDEIVITATP